MSTAFTNTPERPRNLRSRPRSPGYNETLNIKLDVPPERQTDIRKRKSLYERSSSVPKTLWRNKGKILLAALLTGPLWVALWHYFQGGLHRFNAVPAQRKIEMGMKQDAALHRVAPRLNPLADTPNPEVSKKMAENWSPLDLQQKLLKEQQMKKMSPGPIYSPEN